MKKTIYQLASGLLLLASTSLFAGHHHSKHDRDKYKDKIDEIASHLKRDIDRLGDDWSSIQSHLENYKWKGVLQDHASSGPVTLSDFRLNGRSKAAVVRPGADVHCEVVCSLDSEKATKLKLYRAIVGLKGEGPQAAIGSSLGIMGTNTIEKFVLRAPFKEGLYQIRFRAADNLLESRALEAWLDEKGREPDASTTIGLLYVKR